MIGACVRPRGTRSERICAGDVEIFAGAQFIGPHETVADGKIFGPAEMTDAPDVMAAAPFLRLFQIVRADETVLSHAVTVTDER